MSKSDGKFWRRIKRPIICMINLPGKIHVKLYKAASHGKLPCPDKLYQKWDYKIFTGKKLDFKHPQTFCEKLQWLKYYYRKPEFTQLVDKYEVRRYIAEHMGEDVLIPCYGVYDTWEDIDFDALPDRFVLKCTHDSGSIAICRGKDGWDKEKAREIIETGLARNQFYLSREWPYKYVKPRIIAEAFLEQPGEPCPVDYKFFCFDGEPKFIQICSERGSETGLKEDHMDIHWEEMPIVEDCPRSGRQWEKPQTFERMKECCRAVTADKPFLRVDFYEIDGKLYFGELTFFDGGGRHPFHPEEYERLLGDWITLPEKCR